jgi:hypothetical protein
MNVWKIFEVFPGNCARPIEKSSQVTLPAQVPGADILFLDTNLGIIIEKEILVERTILSPNFLRYF